MKYICLCLVVLGYLGIPATARAAACGTEGSTFVISEGLIEPVNEVSTCTVPITLPPLTLVMFDIMEPNPSNPLLPVSDYLDITNDLLTGQALLTLTSDGEDQFGVDIGLASRALAGAIQVPEVILPSGESGALIHVKISDNIAFDVKVISEAGAGGEVPEPASVFLLGAGLTGLVALKKRLGRWIGPKVPA
jgi:PEP-CTERM motif-containing protein